MAPGTHSNSRAFKAQKGPWPASFRNPSGSQRRQTALLLILLKGRSDFAVQAGADLASQLAQNIAEAFLWRRPNEWVRLLRLALLKNRASFYATIVNSLMLLHRTGQRLRTDRTSYSVAREEPQTGVRNGKL